MIFLRSNWLTEGLIDFEYKKYVLLGYLLDTQEEFREWRLYPALPYLERHYRNLCTVRDNKEAMDRQFPRVAVGVDIKNMKIVYQKMERSIGCMQEIEDIVKFSIPKVRETLAMGKQLQDHIENELNVFPVGSPPEHLEKGYIFIHLYYSNKIAIYQYETNTGPDERMHLRTRPLGWECCNERTTLEGIKKKMAQKGNKNPYTLAATCDGKYPIAETLLPIVEKIALKRITSKTKTESPEA